MNTRRIVDCPTCLKKVTWETSNPFRPFCSERCKLIDLGDWASGKHAIPGESIPDYEDSEEQGFRREDYLD